MGRIEKVRFEYTPQQRAFCDADCDEIGYGGAAGGGKTFVQSADSFEYACMNEESTQLILRKTFPELERNVIRQTLKMFPKIPGIKYNASKHLWTFPNGSIIEFGYLQRENDVHLYQGAEYDCIRFDEATHFSYESVEYLRSRLRGSRPYKRCIKYTTNPGNIGHLWFKKRFVDPVPPGNIFRGVDGTRRLFIPARVYDNPILMQNDPGYIQRLESLSNEVEKKMLLDGSWDVFKGAFFSEFDRKYHTCDPFDILCNKDVKLYRSIDYGLDMLACYWYAVLPKSSVNPHGSVFVYRELCAPDKTISQAARLIKEATSDREHIICTYAPPDVMKNRDRTTGRNQGDIFAECGLSLTESNNDRKAGWSAVKEFLQLRDGGRPILKIFNNCTRLIKHLPMLTHDDKNYGDVKKEPHDITHSPDSLRYFCVQWHKSNPIIEDGEKRVEYPPDMLLDYRRANPQERAQIEKMMGGKPKLTR